jgi:hypothetical protein
MFFIVSDFHPKINFLILPKTLDMFEEEWCDDDGGRRQVSFSLTFIQCKLAIQRSRPKIKLMRVNALIPG